MAETEEATMSIDEALTGDIISQTDNAVAVSESEVTAVTTEAADSKDFTTVDADGNEVHYVTMTQEEAEAAGVEDDEQVVTTSLQFDPANPSVLYTADGTLINQADLSPEEQALVQAALQQHLAEQEAEQQLALIEQTSAEDGAMQVEQTEAVPADAVSTEVESVDTVLTPSTGETAVSETQTTATAVATSAEDPVAVISSTTIENPTIEGASPSTTASRMVQTFADSVRRQAEYKKAQDLLERAETKSDLPDGFRYEEKIVIRQGQPQVVKVPVRAPPAPKRPEIPAVLANLMPKIEIGKDGSQVIRIHQSQITADQLKSLQENPNVRLVFRPAGSSRNRPASSTPYNYQPRKRGRPRKNYISTTSPALSRDTQGSPSKKYGKQTKIPYHQKDFLSGDMENGDLTESANRVQKSSGQVYPVYHSRRGRPPGSQNKSTLERAYRRAPPFSRKMEQLREQELQHDEELTNARLSIVPQKPVLSSVELAISTRRKNRLRELLGACSEHEIMEVALPHLARVFSLWEFLIMKVERNKLSRVYFADVYKEYEILHRYVTRLTEKYKAALVGEKPSTATSSENGQTEESVETEKKKLLKVRCKMLAQSLGLEQDELEDAFITLLDAEELTPSAVQSQSIQATKNEDNVEVMDVDGSLANVSDATAAPVISIADSTQATQNTAVQNGNTVEVEQPMQTAAQSDEVQTEKSVDNVVASLDNNAETATNEANATDGVEPTTGGTQIIQIGTGDDKQFIEVPEGYTLIQTPDGLVMSQPGTTLSQGEDGTIYVTHEDGTTTTLDSQKAVALDAVDQVMGVEEQEQTN